MRYITLSCFLLIIHLNCYGQSNDMSLMNITIGKNVWHHKFIKNQADDDLIIEMPKDSIFLTLKNLFGTNKDISYTDNKLTINHKILKSGESVVMRKVITKDGKYLNDGDWTFFDSAGKLVQISVWNLGKLIKITNFSKNGDILSVHTY